MAKIKWTPVDSSNLDAVSYDEALRQLAVRFKSNLKVYYVYAEVSPEKNQEFMSAPSQGSFLARQIKTQHEFTKVEGE